MTLLTLDTLTLCEKLVTQLNNLKIIHNTITINKMADKAKKMRAEVQAWLISDYFKGKPQRVALNWAIDQTVKRIGHARLMRLFNSPRNPNQKEEGENCNIIAEYSLSGHLVIFVKTYRMHMRYELQISATKVHGKYSERYMEQDIIDYKKPSTYPKQLIESFIEKREINGIQ